MSKTWHGRSWYMCDRPPGTGNQHRELPLLVLGRRSSYPKWPSIRFKLKMRCHFGWQVWAFTLYVRVCGVRSSQGTDESGCSSWRGTRHRDVAALTEQSAPRSASASYKIPSLSVYCDWEGPYAYQKDTKDIINTIITMESPRSESKRFSNWCTFPTLIFLCMEFPYLDKKENPRYLSRREFIS